MSLALVPSPLIEPRYFLVPSILFHLHALSPSARNNPTNPTTTSTPATKHPIAQGKTNQAEHVPVQGADSTAPSACVHVVELVTILAMVFVNLALLYVFVARSFVWPDGSIARFMI